MKFPVVTICLASVNVVLVVLVAHTSLDGSMRDAILNAESPRQLPTRVILDLPASSDVTAIKAQAVFHRTRSFYIAPAAPTVEAPTPDYRFAGSMSAPNQPPSAVLIHNQTSARVKVVAGDQLESWTVAEVGAKSVRVILGERSAEIASAGRSAVSGFTIVSGDASQSQPQPSAGVRVLGAGSGTRATPPPPATPSTNAPRLYRPPTSQ